MQLKLSTGGKSFCLLTEKLFSLRLAGESRRTDGIPFT